MRRLLLALALGLLIFCAPGGASADWITRSVTIAWDPASGASIAGYRIHYGTRSGNYTSMIDVGGNTWGEVPNLVDGTTYFFAVTAYTSEGEESSASEEFVHTPNPAMFLNMSTRARVDSGDDVMITGFIIGGSSWKTVIVRALGPSLVSHGVANRLSDPVIELYGPGGLIAENNNWREGDGARLESIGFAPADEAEAALIVTLGPGAYSVVVRGNYGAPGTALLEVYDGGIPVP